LEISVSSLNVVSPSAEIEAPSSFIRDSLSPAEFATRHGKSKTWAYRMMYAGKVRVIKGAGTIRIPLTEAGRFCQNVEVYQGRVTPPSMVGEKGAK
jgi:hypothetical protein